MTKGRPLAPDDSRKVTIAAIARLAGVSPQTRERVEELLARHGYRRRPPSMRASSGLIDLVFNDLDSPWAVEIIRGVEDVAHASGIGTVVSVIHRRSSSAKQWLDNMRTRSTEGVIFVTSTLEPPLQAELRRLNIRYPSVRSSD